MLRFPPLQERWQRKREQSVKRAARAERNTVVALQGARVLARRSSLRNTCPPPLVTARPPAPCSLAGAGDEQAVAEGAFSKGLSSVCPRCGQGDFERTADQVRRLKSGWIHA